MTSQVIYPHIEKTSNDSPAHLKRVPRVRVAQIFMDYLAYGWSVEEMNRQHPYLTLGDDQLLARASELGRVLFTQDIRFKALAEDWQHEGKGFER